MECSICLEEFCEPRILPCGHTFCTLCLQQLIGELGIIHYFFNQTFRCPLCRRSLEVPSMGAQGFPSDVSMVDALITSRAVQRRSNWTPERNATTPQRNNQPAANNASGGNKYVYVLIVVISILFRFKGENKASSPSGISTKRFILYTHSGHLTMSIIHNEVFAMNPTTSHGEIRDRATLKYKRSWSVGIFFSSFYSIAGNSFCKKNNYIYVSTTWYTILKIDFKGDIIAKWSTGYVMGRPALTVDCNVAFIPHDGTTRIFLYTPLGDLIHIFQLKMNIGGARLNCAVQLPNGNFVVSYGTDQDKQHGVSLTDSKGNVLRSFGGIKGEGTNRVNGVYDMIADESGNVYAVDHNNHRILRLNSDLEYVNEFVSAESGLRFLHGAIFDEMHGRLFVMGSTWDDTISNLSPGKIFVYETQG